MLYPRRTNIPSQAPSQERAYLPTTQRDVGALQDIVRPHERGSGPPSAAFVVSTFDARPINAADFQTQSGSNANDTGFLPEQGTAGPGNDAYITASAFFEVPSGYQAILRDYHILTIPASGSDDIATGPIFGANGVSNFPLTISILVNGTYQNGVAGFTSWAGAFGDIFGECYVLGNAGDVIEIRVTSPNENVSWFQMLINMHGNLLLSKSGQLEFAPATQSPLPVRDQHILQGE